MKKTSLTIMAVLVVLILLSQACGKKNIPGGPYDSTPTPGPQLWLSVNVKNINPSGTPVAVNNLTITAQSTGVIKSTITNTDGTATLEVFGYGNHVITIPGSLSSGFPSDLTYNVNIIDTFTTYNIVRGKPSFDFSLKPGYNTSYTYLTTTVKYDLIYHTDTKKYCQLGLDGLSNTKVGYSFNPPYVENDGDTSTLTIITPKYFDAPGFGNRVTFTVRGTYTDTYFINIGYDEIVQNWTFVPGVSGSITGTIYNPILNFCIWQPGGSINGLIQNMKVKMIGGQITILKANLSYNWNDPCQCYIPSWSDIGWYNQSANATVAFNGGSYSNYLTNFFTYTQFMSGLCGALNVVCTVCDNGNLNIIRCIKAKFAIYTDDGFYKEYEIQACQP